MPFGDQVTHRLKVARHSAHHLEDGFCSELNVLLHQRYDLPNGVTGMGSDQTSFASKGCVK